MTNMQQFLKPLKLTGESQLIGSIPFEAGVRFGDWFFNLNTAFPGVLGDDFKPTMTTASLLVERTVLKSRNYRFNVGGVLVFTNTAYPLYRMNPIARLHFRICWIRRLKAHRIFTIAVVLLKWVCLCPIEKKRPFRLETVFGLAIDTGSRGIGGSQNLSNYWMHQ